MPAGTVRYWLDRGEAACDLKPLDPMLIASCFAYARMLLDEAQWDAYGKERVRLVPDTDTTAP